MAEKVFALFLSFLIPGALAAQTYWYDIDFSRSQITFLAKSRVVNANGVFRKWIFKGKIGGNFHVVGDVVIECNSIDTDNDRRDKHLMSADFFDCEKHPQHLFRVRTVKADQSVAAKAAKFTVEGDLSIHGVTQPVTLTLAREGDETKPVLTGSLIIDREKFGMNYNSTLNPIEQNVRIDLKLFLNRRVVRPPHATN